MAGRAWNSIIPWYRTVARHETNESPFFQTYLLLSVVGDFIYFVSVCDVMNLCSLNLNLGRAWRVGWVYAGGGRRYVGGIVYPGRESNTSAAFFLSFILSFLFPRFCLVCFLSGFS